MRLSKPELPVRHNWNHAIGEPCAVIDLAVSAYGETTGMTILWEETCFPFDDTIAMEQLQEFIEEHGT